MVEITSLLCAIADRAAGFLLTYLLHSTLLCGGALIIWQFLKQRALRLQEGLLRLALLGSVLTACLPLHLPAPLSAVQRPLPPLPTASAPRPVRIAPRILAESPAPPAAAPRGMELSGGVWLRVLCGIWFLGAGFLLLRTAGSFLRLRALLADRRPLSATTRAGFSDVLPAEPRIRLTMSQWAPVPLALGIVQPEICLPQRALTELDGELLRGAMLHEVAHLRRRDPAWRIFGRLLGCLAWPQLLVHLVLHRLHAIAEYLCDDWSATRTGRPLVLARCLTEVAGWLTIDEDAATVPGMLHTESELARRVGRLLSWEDRSDPMKTNAYLIPMGGALLFLIATAAPRFVVSTAGAAPAVHPRASAMGAEIAPLAAPPSLPAPPSATPPARPTPPQGATAPRAPRPPAARMGIAAPPIPPVPPVPPLPPLAAPPPLPPLPPAEISGQDASDHAFSQKVAALTDAARRGDHAKVAQLEREVEALAEAKAQRAFAALEPFQEMEEPADAAFPPAEELDSRSMNREVAESVRDAMREAKEQLREVRRHAVEEARRAVHEHAHQMHEEARAEAQAAGAGEEWPSLEAERAQLEAERAQLEAARAQLQAERAQLEAARRALHSPNVPHTAPTN